MTPEPWRVSFSPGGDVHLHVGTTAAGTVTVILPALEAHKLGSALHAASGLDQVESAVLGPEVGDGDIIVICGIPYRISTLGIITEQGTLPSVVLHHADEGDAP